MDELQKLLASIKQAETELRSAAGNSGAQVEALKAELVEMRAAVDELAVRANRPSGLEPHTADDPAELRQLKFAMEYIRTGEVPAEARSLGFVDGDASFILPAGYAQTIRSVANDLNEIRPKASVGKTGSASVKTPVMARPKAAYGNVTPTDQELAVGGETLEVNPLKVLVVLSEENLADSEYDLYGKVSQLAAEAIASEEADKFALGTGNKQPTGIITATVSLALESETSGKLGATDEEVVDFIMSGYYGLKKAYRKNAVIMCNSQTEQALDRVRDDDGKKLLTRDGVKSWFNGIEIVTCEAMDDIGAGKTPIVVGNIGAGYDIYDRSGVTVKRLTGGNYDTSSTVGILVTARHAAGVVIKEAFRPLKCKA